MMKTLIKSSLVIFIAFFVISPKCANAQSGDDLINAIAYQDLDKVKSLIETGVDINFQYDADGSGTTPLMMACMYNFADIAKYLLDKGADVSIISNRGTTALMGAAAVSGEMVDLLLAKGADISVKDRDGNSAYMYSISGVLSDRVGFEVPQKFLDKGVDVDESADSGAIAGYTTLMMAAGNKRPDIVKFLAENGADVNTKAGDGQTPLGMAERENDQEMIAILKELGAK
ncbi:ankyrin repeat domain-containing protein [Bacteroidota bacterium]